MPPPTTLPPLVASDLDGTLLRSDRTVSDRTRRSLHRAVSTGARLVYVTGRPPRWLGPVVAETGITATAVCLNGGVVVDLADGRRLATFPFARDAVADVVARLRREIPDVLLGVEWPDGFAHQPGFASGAARAGDEDVAAQAVRDDEGMVAEPVVKLLARHPDRTDLGPAVRQVVGEDAIATWSTHGGLVEVSAPGVHKASTLAWLAGRDGLGAADTIAFGDMPNDLTLLSWAGWGVAMAQGHDDVRAIADEVTATNDDDGVARVLDRLLSD